MQRIRLLGRLVRAARLKEGVAPSLLSHKANGNTRFFHEDGTGTVSGSQGSFGMDVKNVSGTACDGEKVQWRGGSGGDVEVSSEDGEVLEASDEDDNDNVYSGEEMETGESEEDLSREDVESAEKASFEFAGDIVQAHTEEIIANQLMLAAETSSESEPEEPPQPAPTSVLYKLSIRQVAKILRKLRAIDLKILNVQAQCQWTDYMVFATGKTTRHIRGMADRIVYAVKKRSTPDNHMLFPSVEGRACSHWMVVDCGDIVVHCFSEEARVRYNLESKWGGQEVDMEELRLQAEEDEKKDEASPTGIKKKKKLTKSMRKKAAITAAKRSTYVPPEPPAALPC